MKASADDQFIHRRAMTRKYNAWQMTHVGFDTTAGKAWAASYSVGYWGFSHTNDLSELAMEFAFHPGYNSRAQNRQ